MADTDYKKAAEVLGWRWSHAHGGYISESHREGTEWSGYRVAECAEDACFLDGIENDQMAKAHVWVHT